MPAPATTPAPGAARRYRYLTPGQVPRRGELTAALATLAFLAHLMLAQVTLALAVLGRLVSRSAGWRPGWLAAPAGAGLVWALAIGPGPAISGLLAGPRQVAAYFAGVPVSPGRVLRPQHAFAGAGHWLPRQFPLALILAAGEVAVSYWLDQRRPGGRAIGSRPGLLIALRRRRTAATIAAGGATTRDGGCLGLDPADGRPAVLTWAEAEGGVLCAGPAGSSAGRGPDDLLAQTCFRLAQAAVRRRKPVIVIDLAGRDWTGPALAAACTDAGAPLRVLSPGNPGSYEPFRGGDPAQAAALVTGMIDWAAAGVPHRVTVSGALTAAFGVLAAAPAEPGRAVLDEVAGLLRPDALRARLGQVPAYHPRRAELAGQVNQVGQDAGPDPAGLATVAAQLTSLRGSALGRWLAPGPARISLGQAVRDRAAVLFCLGATGQIGNEDRPAAPGPGRMADWAQPDWAQPDWAQHDWASWNRPARMMASLAAGDLIAVCAELGKTGVPADALAWVHGCEAVPAGLLRELVAAGSRAGLAVMLSTESAGAAAQLADAVNVVVACGPDGLAAARRYARLAPIGDHPAGSQEDPRPHVPLPAQYVRPRPGHRRRAAPGPACGRFAIVVKRPERVQAQCEGIGVPRPAVSS